MAVATDHNAPNRPTEIDARVAFRIRVGITGHRNLPDAETTARQIREFLGEIPGLLTAKGRTPVLLTVVSPLAEGADRLAAHAVEAIDGARLEIALPLPADDYETDFASEASKQEFRAFLAAWPDSVTHAEVIEPHDEESKEQARTAAYQAVGRYVADRCDLLIAVWDGEEARGLGGTAEIVGRALRNQRPVYWIRSDPTRDGPGWHPESERDLGAWGHRLDEDFEAIEAYNETVDRTTDASAAVAAADGLADRFQRQYRGALMLTFVLAAAAVVAIAAATAFERDLAELAWLELTCLVGVFATVIWGHRRRVQEKYLGYRFLAERLREAPFLASVGIQTMQPTAFTPEFTGYPSEGWPWRAVDELWSRWPKNELTRTDFLPVRACLAEHWIEDQRRYHARTAQREYAKHVRIRNVSLVLFGLTIVAAALHVVPEAFLHEENPRWEHWMAFTSISFGAMGAALAGYGSQRGHRRQAARSRQMITFLAHDAERMRTAPTPAVVRQVAEQTHEHMLAENRDWFGEILFEEIDIHT